MVSLSALWLPIVLSAVIVFIASSIMHMLLPYHRSDYQQLPEEDKVLGLLRGIGLKRGLYVFPFCTHKNMKSPEIQEKYKQGPVGMLTLLPSGPPVMPKFLGQWCLLPDYWILRGLSHGSHGRVWRELPSGVPRGGNSRVPCLRPWDHQQ